MAINVIYGILTGGVVTPDMPAYRRTTAVRSKKQHESLTQLLRNVPDSELGVAAEVLMGFMKASEKWPEFVEQVDPTNTYILAYNFTDECSLSYTDIAEWLNEHGVTSDSYPVYEQAVFADRLAAQLFSLLTIED